MTEVVVTCSEKHALGFTCQITPHHEGLHTAYKTMTDDDGTYLTKIEWMRDNEGVDDND